MIANRIKELYDALNLNRNRFAKEIGFDQSAIGHLEKGRSKAPSRKLLAAIYAKFPQVNPYWLETGAGNMFISPTPQPESIVPTRLIPVINGAQCGSWVDFTDLNYPEGVADRYERAPTHDPSAFYVVASGDSMTGSGIAEGDLLLVEPGREVFNGCTVLAKGDNGCTVKKFQRKDNTIVLLPTNDKYDRIILTAREVKRDRIRFMRITKVVRDI